MIKIMFGTRVLLQTRYLRMSGSNIHSIEGVCWSKLLAKMCSRFDTCRIFGTYFNNLRINKRRFKLCCFLSDKRGSIGDDSKLIAAYTDSRITVGSRNINNGYETYSANDSTSGYFANLATYDGTSVQLGKSEFLGIEVFPEIFDQLPPKCTGCGAILQSQYKSKPGFIPENRNPNNSRNLEENLFRSEIICARCFSLKHYSMDVHPLVLPEKVSKFLSHICRRKALVLYVVNVMDIPGSFATDILKIVGETKHIILVCNKVDQLPVDGHPASQMQCIKQIILAEARKFGLQNANVLDVSVISAKTGFGIHDLAKAITKYWRKDSDIYLVGCHNSGKTMLFNLLCDLFSASRHMDNMLQRGTVCPSPGTTLSLLRQPVTKHRFLRLQDRLAVGYSEVRCFITVWIMPTIIIALDPTQDYHISYLNCFV